jgi:hypothetical protein
VDDVADFIRSLDLAATKLGSANWGPGNGAFPVTRRQR